MMKINKTYLFVAFSNAAFPLMAFIALIIMGLSWSGFYALAAMTALGLGSFAFHGTGKTAVSGFGFKENGRFDQIGMYIAQPAIFVVIMHPLMVKLAFIALTVYLIIKWKEANDRIVLPVLFFSEWAVLFSRGHLVALHGLLINHGWPILIIAGIAYLCRQLADRLNKPWLHGVWHILMGIDYGLMMIMG